MADRPQLQHCASRAPGDVQAGAHFGRDLGPISTRNTSKGALIVEAHKVFRELARGIPLAQVRSACLEGRLLRQPGRETKNRIWDALHWRYFAWSPPDWVLQDFGEATRENPDDARFVGLLYLHYARRNRLTFDFVTERLWGLWKSRHLSVHRDDVLDFLSEYEDRAAQVARWREVTRRRLASNVLSALRDFGLLRGTRRKILNRPLVPPEVALHLVHLLHAEGVRGRALLEAPDWRLFLWAREDTTLVLGRLAQRGDIRFEGAGRAVIPEVPERAVRR